MTLSIAITGGAGCIGGAIADMCIAQGHDVLILDRSEQALFWSMERRPAARHRVCDVAVDCSPLRGSFDTVFHAAAYKHVPLMESEPWEAIRNNVVGTRNVLAAGHQTTVLVSTDKAAGSSLMGRTKWMAERLALAAGQSALRLVNVLNSPGSVLDVWRGQSERGEPLTVTDPDAERYWMTVEQAAGACLDVAGLAPGLYAWNAVPPMPMSLLLKLHFPGRETRIVGLRPGDALNERLCGDGETLEPTSVPFVGRITTEASASTPRT